MSGKVAPHQNSEVRLVLGGLKPLATVERDKDLAGYALAVSLSNVGMLYAECRPTDDCERGEIVFTKPANRGLVDRYNWLLDNGVKEYGIKGFHRQMGKLFGYSDADIETFINAEIHCDCSKCKGK